MVWGKGGLAILTHRGCSEGQRVAHQLGIQRREETLGVGGWLQGSPQLEGARQGRGRGHSPQELQPGPWDTKSASSRLLSCPATAAKHFGGKCGL